MPKHRNKIEKLIVELCPEGVEFKELQELFITKNGYTPSTANKDYWTDGTVPWFRMEDIRENGRVISKSLQQITKEAVKGGRLFPANSIIVATSATIGEHALITVPHLSNQRFTSLALKPKYADRLQMKFVFYYCFVLCEWCRKNITTSSFASVDMNGFKKFAFPLPPLAIQQEIVRILDNFTKLEAELEAELEARKKQYEYYRNELLMFARQTDRVRWLTLGEIGTMIRGSGLQKKDFTTSGVGCVHYGQIYTYYGTYANKTKTFVSPELAKKLKKAQKGDVLISGVSENIEDVCKPLAWLGDEICISGDMFAFRHNQNTKFITYLLQTTNFKKYKERFAHGAKVIRVKQDKILDYKIPVPPLAEQERIVAILDKFDALVNGTTPSPDGATPPGEGNNYTSPNGATPPREGNLSASLPAELNARRKQYEYYRDKLLTFKNHPALAGTPPQEGNENHLPLTECNSPPLEGCQSKTDGVV